MIKTKTFKSLGVLGATSIVLAITSTSASARVADWAVPLQTATDLRALTQLKQQCEAGNVALQIKSNPDQKNTYYKRYVYDNCLMNNGYLVNGFVVYNPTNGVDNTQSIYNMDVIFAKQNVRYKGQGIVVTPDHVVINNSLQQFWPVGPGQKIDKRPSVLDNMEVKPSDYYRELSQSTITGADLYYNSPNAKNYTMNGFVRMVHNNTSYALDLENVNFNTENFATSYEGSMDYQRSIAPESAAFNDDYDWDEAPNTVSNSVKLTRNQYAENNNQYLLKGDALSEFRYFDFRNYNDVKEGPVKVKEKTKIKATTDNKTNVPEKEMSSDKNVNVNVGCAYYDKASNDLRNYVSKQHNYIAKNLSECKDYSDYKPDYHVSGRPYYEYYNFVRPPAFYPKTDQQKKVSEFSRRYNQNYNSMYLQSESSSMTDGYGYWQDDDTEY